MSKDEENFEGMHIDHIPGVEEALKKVANEDVSRSKGGEMNHTPLAYAGEDSRL